MRLEPPPPQFAAPVPCSLQQPPDNEVICSSLDIVDNNNATTATPDNVLSGWARSLQQNEPNTPEEEDDEDDEGVVGTVRGGSSCGVSEAEEEEVRSSSCCSSTSSELAHLASSSSSEDEAATASPRDQHAGSPATPTSESDDDKDAGTEKETMTVAAAVVAPVVLPAKPAKPTKPVKQRTTNNDSLGAFDVFTMETALPKLDLAQLESHLLAAARREDRRRRNDREEIRRRLAMGEDTERPGGRKPSLQSRLQSGMNLQLCFMNETASDCESPPDMHEVVKPAAAPPVAMSMPIPISLPKSTSMDPEQMQREAQMALAQASAMAHMEMALERHQMRLTSTPSPTSQLLQRSLHKVGVAFPPERRRVSRQLLTDMNVTQLQVLVNDLHTLIEGLNEELVQLLMERDDLHMEQDSRLVDIEDLNRYLGAKSQPLPAGLRR